MHLIRQYLPRKFRICCLKTLGVLSPSTPGDDCPTFSHTGGNGSAWSQVGTGHTCIPLGDSLWLSPDHELILFRIHFYKTHWVSGQMLTEHLVYTVEVNRSPWHAFGAWLRVKRLCVVAGGAPGMIVSQGTVGYICRHFWLS